MRAPTSKTLFAFLFIGLLSSGSLLAAGLSRSFDIRDGGDLVVDAEGSKVLIETGGSGADIEITRRGDSESDILDDYRIDFIHEGNRLVIEVEKKRSWKIWDWGRSLSIRARIPQAFNVDVSTSGGSVDISELDGTVVARTSGGSIELASSKGDADVRTSGGSIVLGKVGGSVEAQTSGGNIHIDRASGAVTATTSGGSIRVDEVRGPIDAKTSGGSVRAYISERPSADSRLSTSGGSVVIYLDEAVGVDLDARASGGKVSSDFDVLVAGGRIGDRSSLEGAVNGGGADLVLRTSGGGIRVLRR